MPQRNSRDQENPTPTLRRSPRFTTTTTSTKISTNNKVHKKHIEVSKSPRKSSTGLRRSPRLSILNPQNNNIERRVTRSSTRHTPGRRVLSCVSTDILVEKRNRSRIPKDDQKIRCGVSRVSECTLGEVSGCGEDENETGKKQAGLKRKRNQGMEENGIVNGWTNEQEMALQSAYFAAKATPNFWKKVARMGSPPPPTPPLGKQNGLDSLLVARKWLYKFGLRQVVPGKSAKDCFDKIHSDFMTPPQPQPRSRVKKMNTSSLSPCATKLLQSMEKNTNKRRYSKPKNHLSRKAVRNLLQKQTDIDRDKEADFFNALESSTVCQNTSFFTPQRNKEGLQYLKKCLERSSSAHNKHLSRLSGSSGATLTSPPVLKPIKNKALHERYVDQLHCREAKRKAATSRTAKGHQNKNDHKNENVIKMDVIKAAKNALISEARDAINQFQNLQTRAMNSFNHDDDDDDDDENHNCDDDEDAR
ncbi:hypothetical protein RND71_001643 [Anisodus tanguticus]|uniref:Uncharacterized protein n=1 Tax=Anisodus tanguticus TaxID=243964 RepID=A0AAE1VW02_9SOLA|nr:hypothetical protein RND71_001643 [Anisodus tanguticus]